MPFDVLQSHSRMSLVFPSSIDGMTSLMPLLRAEKANEHCSNC